MKPERAMVFTKRTSISLALGWLVDGVGHSFHLHADKSARPSGSVYKDYYQLSITASDTNGDDYKTIASVKWNILEELPAPVDMDDEMLSSYIDQLKEEIAELEAQQNDDTILNEQYKEDIAAILTDKRAQYDTACDDLVRTALLRTCNLVTHPRHRVIPTGCSS